MRICHEILAFSDSEPLYQIRIHFMRIVVRISAFLLHADSDQDPGIPNIVRDLEIRICRNIFVHSKFMIYIFRLLLLERFLSVLSKNVHLPFSNTELGRWYPEGRMKM